MTLAKGMFYPLFIVMAFALSIPLKIAEQLAYLGASSITAFMITRAAGRRWIGLLMFTGLAFNPVLWHHWLARVSRESLYTALSIGLFGLVILISFPELRRTRRNVAIGLSFGVVWAAFWLTREESIWLLPACLVPIALGIGKMFVGWRRRLEHSVERKKLPELLQPILLPLFLGSIVWLLGIGLVASVNWHFYGVFRTNEFRSGGFVRAYGALARIEGSHFRRFVSVPLDARQKAYEVSGAAKELSNSLDGDQVNGWAAYGCWIHPIPAPCDQQAWFMWALRDAVEGRGHYRSAIESEAFYTRLANEINYACDSGKIRCLPLRETFAPPFRWEYVGETLQSAKRYTGMVLDMGKGEVGVLPSVGSPQGLATFADITDEYISPPVGGTVQDFPLGRVDGWVAARSDTPTLEVISYTKRQVKHSITLSPAPDVAIAHPDLKSVRFTLESDCPAMECDLSIRTSAGLVLVPFRSLLRGAPIDTPNLVLFIDRATADETASLFSERRRTVQRRIGSLIGKAYARSSRGLSVMATIGMLISVLRFRRWKPSIPLLALAVGSLVAVVSRVMLLAYIDAVSYPPYYLHYCSPASPFLIVFVVSGLYLGYSSISGAKTMAKPSKDLYAPLSTSA
jgi:hypothetical protein